MKLFLVFFATIFNLEVCVDISKRLGVEVIVSKPIEILFNKNITKIINRQKNLENLTLLVRIIIGL